MARPRIQIDEEQLRKLAAIHCTMQEIAYFFEVSVDTLERRYADTIAAARANGKMSLRRKRFEVALSGSVPMLIWLSRIILGESDAATKDDPAKLSTDQLVSEAQKALEAIKQQQRA
jgi:hypothetical protein